MTKRNTDLLSNKDMFIKYANIVEVARNARIIIKHQDGENMVKYLGLHDKKNRFMINSATPNREGIEKFTGIIHELGHILFESPFVASGKLIRGWTEDKGLHAMYMQVFNVLEDQRIESHTGRMYRKHGERFMKTREKLGLLMKDKVKNQNPVDILLAIRFLRGEDIENNTENYYEYQKAIYDSELTDKYGALRVLVSIKPLIDKYFTKREEKQKELKEKQMNLQMNQSKLSPNEQAELDTIAQEKYTAVRQEQNDQQRSSGEDNDPTIPDDLTDLLNMNDDEIDEMLDNSKDEGAHVVDDVFSKLRGDGKTDRTPTGVKLVKRERATNTKPNIPVSKGLGKIFKHLMMKKKDFIDREGEGIDIEEFVERLIGGNDMGNCRVNNKMIHGTSLVVSIDASTSMQGNRINTARELVATMFDSTKSLDNIDIKANVWSSNNSGDVGITEIHSLKDVEMITVDRQFAFTPTHMALEHSARMLRAMKGSKKMLILITDGHPNYHKNGFRIPINTYIKMCKKSLLKCMNVTPNIMCVVVQDSYMYRYNIMKKIMKSTKIMRVDTMAIASEKVIKRFKQLIMRSIA